MMNKSKTKNSKETLHFTGQEKISEILEKFPQAQEVLVAHGLNCAGCHIGAYETLEQGAMGHGFRGEQISRVIEDINELAKELKIPISGVPQKNPVLTKKAAEKIKEFQTLQKKEGQGFKIDAVENFGDFSYFLDFLEKPKKEDKVLKSRNIKLFISQESLQHLKNCKIDFVKTEEGEGFKVVSTITK